MSLGIDALDHGVQELNGWIKEIADRLGTEERRLAHCALRATLHAVRDRVGPDHASHLAAQLPLLVRSIFFDGYNPAVTPRRERSRGAFLEQVHIEGVQPLDLMELERAVKVVLAVIEARTDRAQIDNLIAQFPREFSDLFPPAPEAKAPPRVRRKQSVEAHVARASARPSIAPKSEPRRHEPKHAVLPPETGIEEIDQSLQEALKWINAVEFRMNTPSSRIAMSALQATLQGIREQLSAEQAARFGDALPLALKGAFYDGWHPSAPSAVTTRKEFLDRIEASAFRDQSVAVERAVKAAMEVIAKKIGAAAMSEAASALPEDLATLWPDEPVPYVDLRASHPHPGPLPRAGEGTPQRQPPARGAKNVRRARNRAAGESTSNAVEPRSGKRAH